MAAAVGSCGWIVAVTWVAASTASVGVSAVAGAVAGAWSRAAGAAADGGVGDGFGFSPLRSVPSLPAAGLAVGGRFAPYWPLTSRSVCPSRPRPLWSNAVRRARYRDLRRRCISRLGLRGFRHDRRCRGDRHGQSGVRCRGLRDRQFGRRDDGCACCGLSRGLCRRRSGGVHGSGCRRGRRCRRGGCGRRGIGIDLDLCRRSTRRGGGLDLRGAGRDGRGGDGQRRGGVAGWWRRSRSIRRNGGDRDRNSHRVRRRYGGLALLRGTGRGGCGTLVGGSLVGGVLSEEVLSDEGLSLVFAAPSFRHRTLPSTVAWQQRWRWRWRLRRRWQRRWPRRRKPAGHWRRDRRRRFGRPDRQRRRAIGYCRCLTAHHRCGAAMWAAAKPPGPCCRVGGRLESTIAPKLSLSCDGSGRVGLGCAL